jgi:hypothetical protein
MMRTATTLIALLSVLLAPIAPAMCTKCCHSPFEQQFALRHDKAHAHLGRHAHHANHVHTVTQDTDANILAQRCGHQLQENRLSGNSAACLTAKPVQPSAAFIPRHPLQPPLNLIATSISGSPTIPGPLRPPDLYQTAINSSQSASAPLRI